MGFFEGSWIFWLITSCVFLLLTNLVSKEKKIETRADATGTPDQLSMQTTFLSFKRGEAGLFFSLGASVIAFFFASIGFVQLSMRILNF